MDAAIDVTGCAFKYVFGERRAGDPPALIASNKKAKKTLKWHPKKTVKDMILSTYNVYTNCLLRQK